MKRLTRRPIPLALKDRQREILGEIRNNTMPDCLYNSIIAGEVDSKPNTVKVDGLLPDFLKDYQKRDLAKSLGQSAVFNINKPGYGKTLETILWIKIILKEKFNALVLCPKSVIDTWTTQLTKYWPGWEKAGTWWITNYEQLYNEERLNIAKSFEWDVIVLDESHNIKSMKSKITAACFQLKSKAKHCLTGTPIKNRPEDLAAQIKWLDNYSITSYTDFSFAFCNMVKNRWGSTPKGLTKDKVMVENLQKLLNVYCVGGQEHHMKGMEGPDFIKVRLKLDPKVKELYKKTVGEYNEELERTVIDTEGLLELGVKISNPIEAATRRQQITSNPGLFNASYKNVKFEWILDWLKGTDEKVLIFSKYAKTIDALEIFLKKHSISVAAVKRDQTTIVRKANIQRWKMGVQVLLGTFGVLGEGVDGLQEVCNYEIFVDREWTASDNEQAERRIYRIGAKKKAIIYILQAIGTIDIKIERVQLDKGHDAAELLDPVSDSEE